MKFIRIAFILPAIFAWIAPIALAYPITAVRREEGIALSTLQQRGLGISKIVHPPPLTEQQKKERETTKVWRQHHAQQHAFDKHYAKTAKATLGKNHRVETTYKKGADNAISHLADVAHHEARKAWKKDPALQKFTHAEVSAKVKPTDGRVWTTARYHNGGGDLTGPTVNIFTEYPSPARQAKLAKKHQ